jgi:16S rRNA (uracil1498-N3)-methyltransferase
LVVSGHILGLMDSNIMRAKIRLFVEQPLGAGQEIALSQDQAHYLVSVMRKGSGTPLALFNGRDGEWLAELGAASKRGAVALCRAQSAPQRLPPDLWLLFAPIKKARTDFIVEKAAELGAARIIPVQTDYTNSERIRQDRLQAHATEAAEQCGGTYVPQVAALTPLAKVLDTWPEGRALVWADEGLAETAAATPLPPAPAAILIGPEGGFSAAERARLRGFPAIHPIALGPRILRADTAAVAALALWQQAKGDWQ